MNISMPQNTNYSFFLSFLIFEAGYHVAHGLRLTTRQSLTLNFWSSFPPSPKFLSIQVYSITPGTYGTRLRARLAFTLPTEPFLPLSSHSTREECHHMPRRPGFAKLLWISGPVLSTGAEIEALLGLSLKQFLVTLCHSTCAIIEYHRLGHL